MNGTSITSGYVSLVHAGDHPPHPRPTASSRPDTPIYLGLVADWRASGRTVPGQTDPWPVELALGGEPWPC
ncbi:hypothetical protein [Streptomyces sp. SAS_270]|uniref:hypothetical protein n=1 Tax=Streptomyces sp. SAS_270 TaxID=3412748 RepID=UPI00403C0658